MTAPLFPGSRAVRGIPLIGPLLLAVWRFIRVSARLESLAQSTGAVNQATIERFNANEDALRAVQLELSQTRDRMAKIEDFYSKLELWKESTLGRVDQSAADLRVLWRASLARNGLAVERAAQAIAERGLAAPQSGALEAGVPRFSTAELTMDLEEALSGGRDLAARARVYLPRIAALRPVQGGFPLLDLGAGQGAWLALLKQAGVDAVGVEVNPATAQVARAKGLDVVLADALGHLRDRDPGSLGAVTGLRLIEHLPFAQTAALIEAAIRALAPGGLLILESLNPENLAVGGCAFWADPSRLRPIPPALLQFHVAAAGFEAVETLRFLRHDGAPDTVKETATVDQPVEPSLTAPMDYAVVARKPLIWNPAAE
jgi:SAM-dependent methyltransferase